MVSYNFRVFDKVLFFGALISCLGSCGVFGWIMHDMIQVGWDLTPSYAKVSVITLGVSTGIILALLITRGLVTISRRCKRRGSPVPLLSYAEMDSVTESEIFTHRENAVQTMIEEFNTRQTQALTEQRFARESLAREIARLEIYKENVEEAELRMTKQANEYELQFDKKREQAKIVRQRDEEFYKRQRAEEEAERQLTVKKEGQARQRKVFEDAGRHRTVFEETESQRKALEQATRYNHIEVDAARPIDEAERLLNKSPSTEEDTSGSSSGTVLGDTISSNSSASMDDEEFQELSRDSCYDDLRSFAPPAHLTIKRE